jgi:hypothetical protein
MAKRSNHYDPMRKKVPSSFAPAQRITGFGTSLFSLQLFYYDFGYKLYLTLDMGGMMIYMNLNLGITPQTQAQQDLYRLAYQCAHSYASVKCNVCPTCTYNVQRYGYDPNEVELIKARAFMDYNNYISNQETKRKSY